MDRSSGGVRRVWRAAFALSLGLATSGVSACSDSDEPECRTDDDCASYDSVALCGQGTCQSPGISCAKSAGMDPLGIAPNGFTNAAVFNEWLGAIFGATLGYCQALSNCGDSAGGPPCSEPLAELVAGTCCRQSLEFFLANEAALAGCPVSQTCEALTFGAHCPALADFSLETACKG